MLILIIIHIYESSSFHPLNDIDHSRTGSVQRGNSQSQSEKGSNCIPKTPRYHSAHPSTNKRLIATFITSVTLYFQRLSTTTEKRFRKLDRKFAASIRLRILNKCNEYNIRISSRMFKISRSNVQKLTEGPTVYFCSFGKKYVREITHEKKCKKDRCFSSSSNDNGCNYGFYKFGCIRHRHRLHRH